MYVDINQLPDSSRVWVYQSNRRLTLQDQVFIKEALQTFTNNWYSHGHPLYASFEIREEYFIILAVDEAKGHASGCSIDSSVYVLREIEKTCHLDLFNRSLIPLCSTSKEVFLVSLQDLRQKYEAGIWNEDCFTFNTLADSLESIRNHWKIAVKESWLKRFMKDTSTPATPLQ